MDAETLHLPRILCLHGGGTSAMIFKIQLRRLAWSLHKHFRLVFLDAPFESAAGPGVLPVFANCDPFYQWKPPSTHHPTEPSALLVRQTLLTAISLDAGTGPWVGLLGFSQGGRMASGLLADLQNSEPTSLPAWKFGVFICASYPPLSLQNARMAGLSGEGEVDGHGPVAAPGAEEIIRVPSVHVRGLLDPHLEKGRRLERYFEEGSRVSLEFVMGHHLPGAAGDTTSGKGDTDEIRDAILRMYGGGRELNGSGVGLDEIYA